MNKPLIPPLPGYPSFQPNQALTAEQLNELADYLEQNDRLTRQRLIGTGIVCGLRARQVDLPGRKVNIYISRGVGVTSAGFLIEIDPPAGVNYITCTHCRRFVDNGGYVPFAPGGVPYNILELLEDPGATNDRAIRELSASDVRRQAVVVLYLEIVERDTDKCLDESCDEKGKRWELTVRKLLIDQADVDKILIELHKVPPPPPPRPLEESFHPEYFLLPEFSIERFGFGRNELDLASIDSLDRFVEAYRPAIEVGGLALAKALNNLSIRVKPLFDLQLAGANPFAGFEVNNPATNPFTQPLLSRLNGEPLSAQYIYDFIREMKATYDELRSLLFELESRCAPNPELFPQHLMLGRLTTQPFGVFDPSDFVPTPTVYRHHFMCAPIYNNQRDLLLQIKQLIQRLQLQFERFNLDNRLNEKPRGGQIPLRITPTLDCSAPLGRQAIPFHYDVNGAEPSLYRYWDFETAKRNGSARLLSYHSDIYSNERDVTQPLLYDICRYPKLRIEGHVGRPLRDAVEALKDLRTKYNLPFDILTLKLDRALGSVYLADDTPIADLQARYLVERNDLVCCIRDLLQVLKGMRGNIQKLASLLALAIVRSQFPLPAPGAAVVNRLALLLRRFYDLMIRTLNELAQALPADLKEFNPSAFEGAFAIANSAVGLAQYFINTWGDIESPFMQGLNAQRRLMVSDWISILLNRIEPFFDRLLDDCVQARLETLYQEFFARVESVAVFSSFAARFPGMEHIAGTTKGGVFILVYEDPSEQKEITGEVIGPNRQPAPNTWIVSGKNPGIIYGATDEDGTYSVHIPKDEDEVMFIRAGYFAGAAAVGPRKIQPQVKLKDWKFGIKETEEIPAGSAPDNLFIELADLVGEAAKLGAPGLASIVKNRAIDASAWSVDLKGLDFSDRNYRVVADFYLPCHIPECHMEVPLKDVCPQDGRGKLMDPVASIVEIFKQLQKVFNLANDPE